jgi:hypothetical protein
MLSKIASLFATLINTKSAMYQSELELYLASKNPKSSAEVEYLISSYNRRRQYGAC